MDAFEVGPYVAAMWRRLGEQIECIIPDMVINDKPKEAIRWATYAEACFWKSTGEAEAHDVKDVTTTSEAGV